MMKIIRISNKFKNILVTARKAETKKLKESGHSVRMYETHLLSSFVEFAVLNSILGEGPA